MKKSKVKTSKKNIKLYNKKILLMVLAIFAIMLSVVFITKKNINKPSFEMKFTDETDNLENAMGGAADFIYVTKTTDKYKNIYNFYYDHKKYFTASGDLQSVFVNKKNPKQDFYIHLNDKLVIYPQKTTINVGYNDNFKFMSKDGFHMGGIWIGEDKNIYKTTLHHFNLDFDCSENFLKILKEKYKMNVTKKECNENIGRVGSKAVCVKYKYNKESKLFKQVSTRLTNSEACDTFGCSMFTYDNLDKNYVQVGNMFPYEHKTDKILEKKIYNKLRSLNLISSDYSSEILFFKTKDLIIARKFFANLSEGKIFILDHNLNLKATFDINLNNSGLKEYIDTFLIRKDNLFVLTQDRKIFLYNLKTLKLIKKFDNIEFFSFM